MAELPAAATKRDLVVLGGAHHRKRLAIPS